MTNFLITPLITRVRVNVSWSNLSQTHLHSGSSTPATLPWQSTNS